MGKNKKTDKASNSSQPQPPNVGPLSDRYYPSPLLEDLTGNAGRLDRKVYEQELTRLQVELVKMQYWLKASGYRLIVLFEGRDAAGKGGTIKRITDRSTPAAAGWWPWAPLLINRKPSGISSATSNTSLQLGRSSYLIAAGTTGLVWNR